jgi:microtubule-associated protein, RP/EB family
MSGAGFGMMEGAYFVPRGELLEWINELLDLDYTKVEQTCNAAAITQVMDILYPGKVPMSKINYNALHEYERVNNFKVLQSVFDKQKIDRFIDVPKLIKGKYQDNLEFLQWTKRFFELNCGADVDEYDAKARRGQAKCVYKADTGGSKPRAKRESANKENTGAAAQRRAGATSKVSTGRAGAKSSGAGAGAGARTKAVSARVETHRSGATRVVSPRTGSQPKASPSQQDARVKALTKEVAELETTRDSLEKERDFYFGRLREIEVFLQDKDEKDPIAAGVLAILYNPADDDEEEGEEVEEDIDGGSDN